MRTGKTVRHCHGKDKGKVIKRHKTVGGAKAHHRATMSGSKKK